jgi:hypothetical protein
MMVKMSLMAVALMSVVGCAGSPAEMASRSPQELQSASNQEVIWAFAHDQVGSITKRHNRKLREEIDRRGLFDEKQWALIDAREVEIGQPERLVWASWGPPDQISNASFEGLGTTRALWYDQRETWVYSDGERITGYSN